MALTKEQIHRNIESKNRIGIRIGKLPNHQFTSGSGTWCCITLFYNIKKGLFLLVTSKSELLQNRAGRQQFGASVSSEYGTEYFGAMSKLADASVLPKFELVL